MRRQPPRAAGCGLERVFEGLAVGENAPRETAQDLSFYEQGGFGCTIHGESVLLGTASFLRKQDVRLPSSINLKTGIFLAIDHQLAAVFAVKYEASENVDYALRTLRRSRITPILAVRDPNITPALLKRKFYKKIKVEYPQLTDRVALSEAEEDRGLPRGTAAAGGPAALRRSSGGQPPSANGGAPGDLAVPGGQRRRRFADGVSGVSGEVRFAHPLVPDGVFAAVDSAGAADERLDRPILTLDRIKYREAGFFPASRYFFALSGTKRLFFKKNGFLRDPTKISDPFCLPLQNVRSHKILVVLPMKKRYN